MSEASKKNRKAVDIFQKKWIYQAPFHVIALSITAPLLGQLIRLEQRNSQLQEKRGENQKSSGPSHICRIYISYKPSARAVLGEYRLEVLTVRTERTVQKRPRADILPVRSRASLVNNRFITRLKLFRRKTQMIDCKDTINFKRAIFRAN